jgi:UDP-N-acetylmuramyl pentapeptide synthase/poly-gamma-glutamate capsule biosynthesis protein CapA/YwtB (metallophosphatase superfamily)
MSKPFKITFCGDTSLGYYYLEKGKNKYPEAYERLQNDPFSFFEGVAPLLEGSDEVIVNLETVLTKNPGKPIEGKEYPGFDDPDVTIEVLKKLGVTAVTLANNHAMDFGEHKLVEMIKLLHMNGIATIGAGRNRDEASEPYVITVPDSGERVYIINGMRARKRYIEYGFFAKKDKPGVASTNFRAIKEKIEEIKGQDPSGKVIVVPHWQGIDYKDVGDKQVEWCEAVLAAGAEAVVAHGSHKCDKVIELKDGRKAYLSLGNFVFNSPGRYRSKGVDPISMVVTLSIRDKEKTWLDREIVTDNQFTGFNVAESPKVCSGNSGEQSGHLDLDFLSSVSGYKCSSGFSEISARGVEYVLNEVKEGEILLVVDDKNWSKVRRERSNQLGLTDKEIVDFALGRGAVGFVAERGFDSSGYPLIKVSDSRKYLLELAKLNRARYKGRVVSVTGTAGKSSTVAMLKSVLSGLGENVLSPSGNTNTLYGVASLLTRLNSSYSCCIVEAALSGYARFEEHVGKHTLPDISVITSLDVSQPEITDTVEGTAFFKCRQVESLSKKGISIFCTDTPVVSYIKAISSIFSAKSVSYGEGDSDYQVIDFSLADSGGAVVKYISQTDGGGEFEIRTPSVAMAKNALAVLATCRELGYSGKEVNKLIGKSKKIRRVLDFSKVGLPQGSFLLIDDTKNATVSSLRESLSVASSVNGKRKVAVIGDLVHLGDYKDEIYDAVGECVASSDLDYFIGFGKDVVPALDKLGEKYLGSFNEVRELGKFFFDFVRDGDVVLVKGASRNTQIRQAADFLKSLT